MPGQTNEFDILTINGYPFNTKDTTARNDIASIIGAIQVNNTSISGRINDLNDRSFDGLIKISSNNETEISSISDGLYKLKYITVETVDEEEIETLINSGILIQQGNNQYLYKNGIIYNRVKDNNIWGTWEYSSGNNSGSLSQNYEMSSNLNKNLLLEPGDTYEEAFGKLEKAIIDNEYIISSALNDIDEQLDNISSGGSSGITISNTVTENDTNPVSGGAVYAKFEDLIGSAPTALDTLGEIANALNNDANLAGTLTTQISNKIPKVSNPTANHFAAFASDGTLIDSGHSHSDYITSETQLSKGTTSGNGNAVTDININNHQITLVKETTFLTSHQSIKTINNQTITGTGNVNIPGLPTVTSSDNGKILMVVNGEWQLVSPSVLYNGNSVPNNSQGNNGDLYVQTD